MKKSLTVSLIIVNIIMLCSILYISELASENQLQINELKGALYSKPIVLQQEISPSANIQSTVIDELYDEMRYLRSTIKKEKNKELENDVDALRATVDKISNHDKIAIKALPAVVKISHEIGGGSGFFINWQGYILTNAHVILITNENFEIIGPADKITVLMQNSKEYTAEVVGYDEKKDIALLKINPEKHVPYLSFERVSNINIGDGVFALGNPVSLIGFDEDWNPLLVEMDFSVTKGIISAKNRTFLNMDVTFIQTDAQIDFGNSGGPLITMDGKVIGMNTLGLGTSGDGFNYAISSDDLKNFVKEHKVAVN